MSDKQTLAAELDALQEGMPKDGKRISELLIKHHRPEIVSAYRAEWGKGPSEGKAVLVATAGVPGAGKSSFVNSSLDKSRYFQIDPDEVRVHCLRIAQREGYFDSWLSKRLSDWQPPRLGELSTLVQGASTSIASFMRDAALRNRENIIMEGTLRWSGHPNAYLGDPATRNNPGILGMVEGYKGFEVYSVEVPEETALQQAESRWWDKRVEGSDLARYMPPSVIERMYPKEGNVHGYSSTLDTVLGMVNHPHAGRYDLARVNVLDRMDAAQPVMVQFEHQPGRTVSADDVAQRAARERSVGKMDRAAQQKEIREKVRAKTEAKKHELKQGIPSHGDPPVQGGPKR